jgi:multiple sugar transport system substrate-binding protein
MTMTRRILTLGFLLLATAGCGDRRNAAAVNPHPFQGVTIRVGFVGDSGLSPTISAQRGEWEEQTGAKVEILKGPVDPLAMPQAGADILVFPGDQVGDLIDADALAVVPTTAVKPPAVDLDGGSQAGNAPEDPFDFPDVLPVYRDKACLYGDQRIAFPLGGSALVLVYRRDVFESEKLMPPKTWEGLDNLAESLHGRDLDGDGTPDAGIAIVTAEDDEQVGVNTFLARSAALGQHPDHFSFIFDDDTMAPEIASPPFVETLGQLRTLEKFSPKGLDAGAARQAFREGKAAMLIDRAEKYGSWNDRKKPLPTGVAALPGSERVFDPDRETFETKALLNRPSYLPRGGGWFAGIARMSDAKARDAAIEFLRYLTGRENSARLLGDRDFPMLPTRTSQLGSGVMDPRSAPGVNPVEWSRAVSESLSASRVVPGLRIPRADAYLGGLAFDHGDFAESTPDLALKAVAKSWSDLTAEFGVKRQLWHYRRSLNRSTPTDVPPPRDAK